MKKAVIFDKDGVLIDSEPKYQCAMNTLLQSLGNYPVYTEEDRKKDAGINASVVFQRLRQEYNLSLSVQDLTQKFKDIYLVLFEEEGIFPMDGVLEFIEKLKKKNITVAIGTGSGRESTEYGLKNAGLEGVIPIIVTASEVTNSKPHPETFLKAAEKLSQSPVDCIVIGDSINDQIGAHAAGMKFVLFAPNGDEGQIPYDMIINSFKDVSLKTLLS